MEQKIEIEVIDFCCAECGNDKWILKIGHSSDGRTLLITQCSSQQCQQLKRDISGDPDSEDMIIWSEFDITGQGHDPEDLDQQVDERILN